MLDPIVAAFSPHRAAQQKEQQQKKQGVSSYAAASRSRVQVIRQVRGVGWCGLVGWLVWVRVWCRRVWLVCGFGVTGMGRCWHLTCVHMPVPRQCVYVLLRHACGILHLVNANMLTQLVSKHLHAYSCNTDTLTTYTPPTQQEQPQEDAQEFIQHFLSKLHEELAEVRDSVGWCVCVRGGGGVGGGGSVCGSVLRVLRACLCWGCEG